LPANKLGNLSYHYFFSPLQEKSATLCLTTRIFELLALNLSDGNIYSWRGASDILLPVDIMQKMTDLQSRSVIEFIPELLRYLERAETATFVMYKPAPGFSTRLKNLKNIDEFDHALYDKAELLSSEHGLPFWDTLLSVAMKSGKLPKKYVELAISHESHPDEHSIELKSKEITAATLQSLVNDAGKEYGVAMSSRVRVSGGEYAHIPMLDFRCEYSERNIEIVKWTAAAVGHRSGIIVNSGRSFHYYGLKLLTDSEWLRFISLASLFSPVVDGRYLAHRLADGACRLRITDSPGKNSVPLVLEVFDDEL
jgi:hypothetical protein